MKSSKVVGTETEQNRFRVGIGSVQTRYRFGTESNGGIQNWYRVCTGSVQTLYRVSTGPGEKEGLFIQNRSEFGF